MADQRAVDLASILAPTAFGVIETLATKGRSPGTGAAKFAQAFQQGRQISAAQEDRNRQAAREAKADAMRERAYGIQERRAEAQEGALDLNKLKFEWEKANPGLSFEDKMAQALTIASEKARIGAETKEGLAKRKEERQKKEKIEAEDRAVKREEKRKQNKPVPPADARNITDMDSALFKLQEIEEAYNPDYVGLAAGRIGGFSETTGIGIDETQALFRSAVAELGNELLKLRSGGAVTPSEYGRLQKEIPQVNLPPKVFMTRLNRMVKTLQTKRQILLDNLDKAGHNVDRFKIGEEGLTDNDIDSLSDTEDELSTADQQLIEKARGGDVEAQQYLDKSGIGW